MMTAFLLVCQLSSPDFRSREKAAAELSQAGWAAYPAAYLGRHSPHQETAERCRRILPSLPDDVEECLALYLLTRPKPVGCECVHVDLRGWRFVGAVEAVASRRGMMGWQVAPAIYAAPGPDGKMVLVPATGSWINQIRYQTQVMNGR
jgi:hypothetical protein